MAKKAVKSPQTGSDSGKKTRPTKKQHETLNFIRHFMSEHGYSPSYREIMNGCNYTSVATVSLHVNSLIKRGHLVKRNRSARSLELSDGAATVSSSASSNHKHELISEVDARLKSLEENLEESVLNEVYVLVGALKILGHEDVARAYAGQINQMQES